MSFNELILSKLPKLSPAVLNNFNIKPRPSQTIHVSPLLRTRVGDSSLFDRALQASDFFESWLDLADDFTKPPIDLKGNAGFPGVPSDDIVESSKGHWSMIISGLVVLGFIGFIQCISQRGIFSLILGKAVWPLNLLHTFVSSLNLASNSSFARI